MLNQKSLANTKGESLRKWNTNLKQSDHGNVLYMSMPQEQYQNELSKFDIEANNLTDLIQNNLNDKDTIIQKTQHLLDNYQTDIDSKENQIKYLQSHANEYFEKSTVAKIFQGIQQNTATKLKDDEMSKQNLIIELRNKLEDSNLHAQQLLLARKSEEIVGAEIHQLKLDNERLKGMLKQSKEYTSIDSLKIEKQKSYSSPVKEERHVDSWNSGNLDKLIKRFIMKHKVSEATLNKFIKEVGQVWERREREVVAKLRSQYNDEIVVLRQKLAKKNE